MSAVSPKLENNKSLPKFTNSAPKPISPRYCSKPVQRLVLYIFAGLATVLSAGTLFVSYVLNCHRVNWFLIPVVVLIKTIVSKARSIFDYTNPHELKLIKKKAESEDIPTLFGKHRENVFVHNLIPPNSFAVKLSRYCSSLPIKEAVSRVLEIYQFFAKAQTLKSDVRRDYFSFLAKIFARKLYYCQEIDSSFSLDFLLLQEDFLSLVRNLYPLSDRLKQQIDNLKIREKYLSVQSSCGDHSLKRYPRLTRFFHQGIEGSKVQFRESLVPIAQKLKEHIFSVLSEN